ncbi:MAG: pro-sigmaK processing inhibitor BofA family protein [Oscillospiraceae bacterium]|nr:pro-sigmaK processing inhibitor BofA family protein [Oscillospiraceae bacterium]
MLLWILAGVSVLGVALAATHQRRPLAAAGISAVCGCCALGLVNALSSFTGVGIALNYATAFVTAVLGVPGVVLLLTLHPFLN